MTSLVRFLKDILIVLGIIVSVPIVLAIVLFISMNITEHPSKIINFHPTNFTAIASTKFFYSIGNELKYSDRIDPTAVSLFHDHIGNFLVSPDNNKIAFASDGYLFVVRNDKPAVKRIVRVNSIWKTPKPLGKQFYRDDDFQWSRNSRILYLIKDRYYPSNGVQLYSRDGELWNYDFDSGSLRMVLKPFPAFEYFFDRNSGIYFSVPNESGDLQLEYFNGHKVVEIGEPESNHKPAKYIDVKSPFVSFDEGSYLGELLPYNRVRLVAQRNEPEELIVDNRTILKFAVGEGFKGPFYCSDLVHSQFLPGGRYFLFNVHCDNYDGQLLIDTISGNYMPLPENTQVYITYNTDTYPHYRITGGGINPLGLVEVDFK